MRWGQAIVAFAAAAVLTYLLATRLRGFALDRPNERSLHDRPVPRTGGLALLGGVAVSSAAFEAGVWLPLGLAFLLAAVSLADDLRSLPTAARLLAHLAASGFFVWSALGATHPFELALITLGVAWITNLYNFMDGSDGLAGGMAVIGFATYALAASLADQVALASTSAAVAAAALGFLLWNFHPARIFLGDVGSIPLGFLAGALGVAGWREEAWPLWFPVLVFAPFVGDATLTLAKRALRRERVWEAHRTHYYQRLVQMGVGHRGTALIAYALMIACSVTALFARTGTTAVQWMIVGAACLALAGFAGWIDVRWRRHVGLRKAGA